LATQYRGVHFVSDCGLYHLYAACSVTRLQNFTISLYTPTGLA